MAAPDEVTSAWVTAAPGTSRTGGHQSWLRSPVDSAVTADPVPVSGPSRPQPGVAAPSDALPIVRRPGTAGLWVVGAHGGAGESSLASLDERWVASGHSWPVLQDLAPCQCVVVARTSVRGLLAARTALTQWASSGIGPSARLVGLVLISDAPGKLPPPLRDLQTLVAGGAPRVWQVPWIEAWRLGEPPASTTPSAVKKLVSDLRSLAASTTVAAAPTEEENR